MSRRPTHTLLQGSVWVVGLMVLLLGCGTDTQTQDTGPDTAVDQTSDLGVDQTADLDTFDPPDVSNFTFEMLKAQYGNITTVAGLGEVQDKGVNGWSGTFEGGAGTSAELSRPHMTMGDAAGNLYIADKDAHAIRKLDTAGNITTVAGTSVAGNGGDTRQVGNQVALNAPNGLYAFEDGTVFIYDLGNDKVRRLDPDGQIETVFTVGGSGAGRGLWVSPDRTEVWMAAGTVLKRWTQSGGVETVASGFVSLGNIDRSPEGWMAATDRDGHLVYRVDLSGQRTVIAGTGQPTGGGPGVAATEMGLNEVRGIWFHPEGGYFLATHKGGQILYVDVSGRIHLFVDGDDNDTHAGDGEPFDAPGEKISEPRAVTMAPNGDILITENDLGYVRRIERN